MWPSRSSSILFTIELCICLVSKNKSILNGIWKLTIKSKTLYTKDLAFIPLELYFFIKIANLKFFYDRTLHIMLATLCFGTPKVFTRYPRGSRPKITAWARRSLPAKSRSASFVLFTAVHSNFQRFPWIVNHIHWLTCENIESFIPKKKEDWFYWKKGAMLMELVVKMPSKNTV